MIVHTFAWAIMVQNLKDKSWMHSYTKSSNQFEIYITRAAARKALVAMEKRNKDYSRTKILKLDI